METSRIDRLNNSHNVNYFGQFNTTAQRTYITAVTYELIQGDSCLYSVYITVDPGCRAVYGVGLGPLTCWDCGFESRRGHGCLSVVSVVCCQV
jgi:hypothetical protein